MNGQVKKDRVGIRDRLSEVRIEIPADEFEKAVIEGVPLTTIISTNEETGDTVVEHRIGGVDDDTA